MTTRLGLSALACLLSIGCGSGFDPDRGGTGGGSGGGGGSRTSSGPGRYWLRTGDSTRLHLAEPNAWICADGKETPATFETIDSARGVYQLHVRNPDDGQLLHFPISIEGSQLWMGVPGQYTATHDSAPYQRVDSYSCGGSGSGGGGGGGAGGTIPPNTCNTSGIADGCSGSLPYSCDGSASCYGSLAGCADDTSCRRTSGTGGGGGTLPAHSCNTYGVAQDCDSGYPYSCSQARSCYGSVADCANSGECPR